MILDNTVFKYADEKGERIRVIYIDEVQEQFAYVNIDVVLGTPKWERLSKIEEELATNVLIKVTDPYLRNIDEAKLTATQREKRDTYWNLINELWESKPLELLMPNTRKRTIEALVAASGIPEISLRRAISRFWQRGMNKNSLLPDYKNSGGKGKDRKLTEDTKVGRPKKATFSGDTIIGINITEAIKKQFELAVNRYYRNSKKITLKQTYNFILRDFFSDQVVEAGEKKYKVWDKARIPTYEQFYYWFKKVEDPKQDIILREGAKAFELNSRELLSNSTLETDGPGTRFQVDATVADVYLVSSLDRNRIIGRPIVYAIIDVFSRLVTGIYVGLEGPSWIGAMMALDNMLADKVEFCKGYGIDITEEQWPAKHLPDIIIADGGEFKGYSVENLINNLNVKIENTSPYRGDLKGIVERSFRTLNIKLKHMTPGAIQKEFRKRGDPDYRLDATLTLEEFTKIYINLVLYHNNKVIDKYPMEKEMLRDNLVAIPSQLWNWGIENKKGRLRLADRELLRLNVLPKGRASISRAGIRFKGLYYGSQKAIEEQWFIKSKVRSLEVVYDPRNMNNIYILKDDGRRFEACHLLEPSMQYKDCILEEIIYNLELISELRELEKNKQNQLSLDLDSEIEKIVKAAKKESIKEIDRSVSKNKKLQGIKSNRAVEKEINRAKEAFVIVEEKAEALAEVIELPKLSEEPEVKESSSKDRLMEMLKRKRDERRGRC
ncbi:Mu transposase C-terminal domain-containing protein [Clostridium sp. C8-1-8]|uniref:Mu transposase C-terminal domain-containing protein n=1 Tax=Clostridium sp. C8-1-8 TaxID=2698831 RepID=UPI00136E616C|nr:Mu transposase C-terminal domain-containing protein [Clostridium sp. C8-1-8]